MLRNAFFRSARGDYYHFKIISKQKPETCRRLAAKQSHFRSSKWWIRSQRWKKALTIYLFESKIRLISLQNHFLICEIEDMKTSLFTLHREWDHLRNILSDIEDVRLTLQRSYKELEAAINQLRVENATMLSLKFSKDHFSDASKFFRERKRLTFHINNEHHHSVRDISMSLSWSWKREIVNRKRNIFTEHFWTEKDSLRSLHHHLFKWTYSYHWKYPLKRMEHSFQ